MNDSTRNTQAMPSVFPDYAAPIVRNRPEGRELALVRWGCRPRPNILSARRRTRA
jgi:putative SOS response-associated peptidase YedK